MPNDNPHSASEMVTRSFVIPRDQDEALKLLASRNHRTFSGELRLMVENHLEAHAADLEEAA